MKTEFDSQITQLKDSINLRVTKTDYDKNNQDLNQSIGNLQTSYNSISGTVSSLNTRRLDILLLRKEIHFMQVRSWRTGMSWFPILIRMQQTQPSRPKILIWMELSVQTGIFGLQQMGNLLQLTDSLQEKLQRQKEKLPDWN